MKQISVTEYDAAKYADENLLYRHRLIDPVTLDINMTFMYGKDSNMFPLLSKTKGEGLIKSKTLKKVNDTTFTWKVYGRMKHVSAAAGIVGSLSPNVGANYMPFRFKMRDGMLIKQWGAMSPNGNYQIRIETEHGKQSDGFYHYTGIVKGTDVAGIPATEFNAGKYWVLTAPIIPASKSDGNRDNTMVPGEWMGQFGYHRYSKAIAGNVSNKVLNVKLPMADGGSTDMWMPYDMARFELDKNLMDEADLWHSEFNRDENGNITTIDTETGEPIPTGAGVKQILTDVGNYDTYSELTVEKLDNTINAVMTNRVDDTPTEIVCYGGDGSTRELNNALTKAAKNGSVYYEALGDKLIGESSGYLTYGKYFKQYRTIDDKIISVINTNLFNHGPRAEQDRANGNMIKGFPAYSYNMVFLDHSKTNDGGRNIGLIAEKGREHITGVYKGMASLPAVWGKIPNTGVISTRKDIATYEIISSMGIYFTNPTTSFWLEKAV